MVSETFINLSDEKKQKIEGALLKEFSTYPLAKAQVARIVKDAGIARGAFYKYFGDLKDSYIYLWRPRSMAIFLVCQVRSTLPSTKPVCRS